MPWNAAATARRGPRRNRDRLTGRRSDGSRGGVAARSREFVAPEGRPRSTDRYDPDVFEDRRSTRRVLRELRSARSRRRLGELDWIDTVYKAYLTLILSGVSIFYLAPVFGDTEASRSLVASIRTDGPAVVGVCIAVAFALGLRSGGRGGPLALEQADISHVLLAPVRRSTVLRSAALRQGRGVLQMGAIGGAVIGTLASLRLPGATVAWLAAGVATGVLVALAMWGSALVASGCRLGERRATGIGLVLIAWALTDFLWSTRLSPTTQVARVALTPLEWSSAVWIGVVLAAAVPIAGLAVVGGGSLENAERRASLVGQLRFAATLQDLRTVMVLHRQLAQELPRSRPWWQLSTRAAGRPCWRRDWQGIARWPVGRVARVAALSVIAGLALVGAREGATALVIIAGAALFLAELDATEGLAQELDHPERAATYPVPWGSLIVRHLVVPVSVLLVLELPALAVVIALSPASTAVVAAVVLIPAAAAGAAAASVALVLGSPSPAKPFGLGFGGPELAGVLLVLRTALPPALMIAALTPLVLSSPPSPRAVVAIILVVATVTLGALAWMQRRRLTFE